MAQNQTFNNVVYSIPVQGDTKWGPSLTRYLAALGTYAISPAGGTYTLTADLNLGANFGLLAKYYKSSSANLSATGLLRLAHADTVAWRNNANSADLALSVNSSDQLLFNGTALNQLAIPVTVANGGTGLSSVTAYGLIYGGTTSTANLQSLGTGSATQVLTSQGPGQPPVWSAAGAGTVVAGTQYQLAYYATSTNAVSGLTLLTASSALATDANGLPVASTTTAAELAFVHGVTSAIQTQINTKAPSASPTFTGTIGTPLTGTRVVTTDVSGNLATGAATMGGALAMGSNKITGLANASASGDAIAWGQAFTSGNHTFSPTTAGIVGTTTNDNAAAGVVGEYVESVVSGVASPTSTQFGDLTSISLTAGDWDVSLTVFTGTSSTTTDMEIGISTTTGNSTTGMVLGSSWINIYLPTSTFQSSGSVPNYRLSLASTTTVYGKIEATYTSTGPTWRGRLSARRRR